MLVSIIIPTFNEKDNIEEIIKLVKKKVLFDKQIIVVDDKSKDGTTEILKKKLFNQVDNIIYHSENLGKGAAIKSSIPFIKGDIIAIQDADLEYDPADLNKLIKLIQENKTKIAYGSRVLGKNRYNNKSFISNYRILGNHLLTIISNILNKQELTDAHTCYKVFRREIFIGLNLQENDFGFCPEVNTKIAKLGENILELPINYNGRSVEDGKKIKLIDAFKALYTIIKYK